MNISRLEQAFLDACKSAKEEGLTATGALEAVPGLTRALLVQLVNRLSKNGLIEFLKRGNELVYRAKTSDVNSFVAGDVGEKLVYQHLEEAGSKGLYPSDLKSRTGLSIPAVNKVLKVLESKGVVKAHLSILGRDLSGKKKVYLLAGFTPDSSITGGSLYDNNDIEAEYVNILIHQTHRFLMQKASAYQKEGDNALTKRPLGWTTAEEAHTHITSLGICKTELSIAEVEQFLQNLVYDGKAEKKKATAWLESPVCNSLHVYRVASGPDSSHPGVIAVPCAFCSLIKSCNEGSIISPKNCEYMQQWLKVL